MDSIVARNGQGNTLNINVVRFFRLNGLDYLIFSLNEVDDGGYIKLYISKINGLTANSIDDESEWNLIKDTIKAIIRANRDNLKVPVDDLNVEKINNVQIMGQKIFKINDSLLQLLNSNKNMLKEIEVVQDILTDNINVEPSVNNGFAQVEVPAIEPIVTNAEPVNEAPAIEPVYPEATIQKQEPSIDYKVLYEAEQQKNTELMEENRILKEKIDKIKLALQ